MIERPYGALLDGAGAEISARLDAFDRQAADHVESVRPLSGQSGESQEPGHAPGFRLSSGETGEKRTTGLEPATFGLESRLDARDG